MGSSARDRCRLFPSAPNWYISQVLDASSDGLVGFASKNSVRLMEVRKSTRQFVGQLVGHSNRVTAFVISPHLALRFLAASTALDKTVRLWDLRTCQCLASHSEHRAEPTAVAISHHDVDLVVSADKLGRVVAWRPGMHTDPNQAARARSSKCSESTPVPNTPVTAMAPSPRHGQQFALGYATGFVLLYEWIPLATPRHASPRHTMPRHTMPRHIKSHHATRPVSVRCGG